MGMTLLTRLERACDNGMVGGVWPKIDSHCDKEEKEEEKEEGGRNMPFHPGAAFQKKIRLI